MKFSVLLGSALHSLKGNARRTILTMLGIIIGIAAVITIMSLGKGFQKMAVSGLAGEDNGKVTVQFFYQPDNPQSVRKVEKAFSKQDRIGVESKEFRGRKFLKQRNKIIFSEFRFQQRNRQNMLYWG